MSDRVRDDEDQPPSKRMKTEKKDEDQMVVEEDQQVSNVTEEKKMEEGEKEKAGNKEEEARFAFLGRIKEEDVGIVEYISQHKGISAVIKQRYSDFVVNEVSMSGEVVHLTNTDLPVIEEEKVEPSGPVDSVIPEEFLAQLKQVASGADSSFTASTPAGDDKDWRLRLHRAVKAAFPNVETKTEEKDGVKVITAMLKGKGRDNRKGKQFQWPGDKSGSKYCRFVMYKENKGTMDVIHLIAKNLRVKESLFSYAGTKDRRAKTTQEVTAFKLHPQKLCDLNKFLHNITLGNFSFSDKRLVLGDLGGNRFTIVLRNVIGDDDDIEAGLTSLKTKGFINYFGLQRFGSLHTCTHHVGRALLKEEWEEAANLIISGSNEEGLEYRKTWNETKDAQATLEQCKNQHYIEKTLLRSLIKRPKDFLGAIHNLARNTRLLYPHSYQSMVWNTVTSRRIKTFGLKPIVGDLVLPPEAAASLEVDVTDEQETKITDEQQAKKSSEEQDAEKTEEQQTKSTGEQETNEDGESNKKAGKGTKPRVQPIVLDETTVSQYSIYDVVLPLPGFDIVYPQNEVQSWYKEILEKDGLDIENMRRKQKDFSLPGGYRPVVIRPKDVEWKVLRYNNVTACLCLSDADRMNGVPEPQSIPDGQMKAVQLSFTLGLSAYATMALREVLKTDTSPAQQASKNVS